MDCLTCQEHFAAMAERDASETTALALEHVRNCPECARAFGSYRRTVQALHDLPLVTPPPSLLPAIQLALDHVQPRRSGLTALWQPLTAGLSLAACLMLVVWATILNPPQTWQGAVTEGPSVPVTREERVRPRARVARDEPDRAKPSGGARRTARDSFRPSPMLPRARPTAPSWSPMGEWAVAPGDLSPAGSTGGQVSTVPSKPAGTFAAGDRAATGASEPLQRRTGPVQLTFVPPDERVVGVTVVGELTIDSEAECEATIGAETRRGLRVVNAPEGVIYRGPIRHGEVLKLPVKLLATTAGTQRLRVWMRTDVPVGEADLDIVIPGFTGRMTTVGQTQISLRFRETPAVQAVREMAAAAGARVVIETDLEGRLVTLDYSAGVPFAAALRILCESVGCQVQERDGVYHVVE